MIVHIHAMTYAQDKVLEPSGSASLGVNYSSVVAQVRDDRSTDQDCNNLDD